jgi:uncharacterized membrane protein
MNFVINYGMDLRSYYSDSVHWYEYYASGAAGSLLLIALVSEFVFKKTKKWVPCFVMVCIIVLYQFFQLVYSLFQPLTNCWYLIVLEGFINNTTKFYLYFLCPIMIAYDNRVTQEMTPTATIIAVVFLCSCMASLFAGNVVCQILK